MCSCSPPIWLKVSCHTQKDAMPAWSFCCSAAQKAQKGEYHGESSSGARCLGQPRIWTNDSLAYGPHERHDLLPALDAYQGTQRRFGRPISRGTLDDSLHFMLHSNCKHGLLQLNFEFTSSLYAASAPSSWILRQGLPNNRLLTKHGAVLSI